MRDATVTQTDVFTGPVTQAIADHWRSLEKGPDALPMWQDVSLMDHYHYAPWVCVKDIEDNGTVFRNRYWGGELVLFFGHDWTGKALEDCYSGQDYDDVRAMFETVANSVDAWRVIGKAVYVKNKELRDFEMGLFPLGSRGRDGTLHILVAYDFKP